MTVPNSDLQYVRDYYGVPAEIDGRIRYTYGGGERFGTIVGAGDARLLILLDGETEPAPFHPTWELEYLPSTASRPKLEHAHSEDVREGDFWVSRCVCGETTARYPSPAAAREALDEHLADPGGVSC